MPNTDTPGWGDLPWPCSLLFSAAMSRWVSLLWRGFVMTMKEQRQIDPVALLGYVAGMLIPQGPPGERKLSILAAFQDTN